MNGSPSKNKKRNSLPKALPQHVDSRRGSIEINGGKFSHPQKEKDINGSLPIIIVNEGEGREIMRTDKSNVTDMARSMGINI
jgi:hypothetical protein